MIVSNFEQGSQEWLDSRIGVVTASRFSDVMTIKQMKPAKNAYIYELCAEIITGTHEEVFVTDAMQRGSDLEPEAREYYEFLKGKTVNEVGLITDDNGLYGCSPDGLIDDDGGLEIKCLGLKAHLECLDNGVVPDKHLAQIYGCLFVTGREYWDFMSYHPDTKELIVRVTKDDDGYIKWSEAFKTVLNGFISRVDTIVDKIKDRSDLDA